MTCMDSLLALALSSSLNFYIFLRAVGVGQSLAEWESQAVSFFFLSSALPLGNVSLEVNSARSESKTFARAFLQTVMWQKNARENL